MVELVGIVGAFSSCIEEGASSLGAGCLVCLSLSCADVGTL